MTTDPLPTWVIDLDDVDSEESRALLREYYVEVSDRWYQREEGRDSTDDEIEAGFPQMRSDDLAPPTGVFLVARAQESDRIGGCVGLRRTRNASGGRVAELRRMYVRPPFRGSGLATSLLLCAEEVARVWGVEAMRLDTRLDLVEGRDLYARNGWTQVPAFSDAFYAEVWLAKQLG